MTTNVGTIAVAFAGDTSKLEAAFAKMRANLGDTSKVTNKLRETLGVTKKAADDLAGAAANIGRSGGLYAAGLGKMTDSAKRAAEKIESLRDKAGTLDDRAGKLQTSIGGLSSAFGVAGGRVGDLVGGVADLAMSFAAGGPLMVALVAVGVAVGAIAGKFSEMEAKAKEAAEKAAKHLADIRQAGLDASTRIAMRASGLSPEAFAAANAWGKTRDELDMARRQMNAMSMTSTGAPNVEFLKSPVFKELATRIAALDDTLKKQKIDMDAAIAADAAGKLGDGKTGKTSGGVSRPVVDGMTKSEGVDAVRDLFADGYVDRAKRTFVAIQKEWEDVMRAAHVPPAVATSHEQMADEAMASAAAWERIAAVNLEYRKAEEARIASNIEGGALMLGQSILGGGADVQSLGSAIGMAAGGPMGSQIASAIMSTMESVVGGIVDTVASILGDDRLSGATGAAAGSMGGAVTAAALLVGPAIAAAVLGPIVVLGGAVLGLVGLLGLLTLAITAIPLAIIGAIGAVLAFGAAAFALAVTMPTFLFQLSQSTESFKRFQGAVSVIVDRLVSVLEPLWSGMLFLVGVLDVVVGVVEPFARAFVGLADLGPTIFGVVKTMAQVFAYAALAAGHLTNTFISASQVFASFLGMGELADQLGSMKINIGNLNAAVERVNGLTYEQATAAGEAAAAEWDLAESASAFNQELVNIPSGYRVPFYDEERPDGRGNNPTPGAGRSETVIINGPISLVMSDEHVAAAIRRKMMTETGQLRRGVRGTGPGRTN